MASVNLYPPYEKFLDEASEEEQRRAEELLDRDNEGILTPEEKIELQQCLNSSVLCHC